MDTINNRCGKDMVKHMVREFGGPNFISWGGCNTPTLNYLYFIIEIRIIGIKFKPFNTF